MNIHINAKTPVQTRVKKGFTFLGYQQINAILVALLFVNGK
jgi:hypothetical protein